jgi:hypothetical protein
MNTYHLICPFLLVAVWVLFGVGHTQTPIRAQLEADLSTRELILLTLWHKKQTLLN